jgi:hypothetical protein
MISFFNGEYIDETAEYYKEVLEEGESIIDDYVREGYWSLNKDFRQSEEWENMSLEDKVCLLIKTEGIEAFKKFIGKYIVNR